MVSICAVINKHRITKGWGILTAQEAELVAGVWLELLDRARIPPTAYDELYKRAVAWRANRLRDGAQAPDFTPELLIAIWEGENGLSRELREREKKNLLPDTVASSCALCFGSGWQPVELDGYTYVKECRH